ncbi:unnamed protein product, partial [Rotaria magnacalcarata]
KPPITTGSTPLPRKQTQLFASLSYRTMNTNTRQHQQQMSKSFIISSKREDDRSTGSLSTTSKSDSLNLESTDLSIPSSSFLATLKNTNKITNLFKPKATINPDINATRSKQLPPLKKPIIASQTNIQSRSPALTKTGLSPMSHKLSTSITQMPKQNRLINSSVSITSFNNNKTTTNAVNNSKAVPPIPPRKSSIPRPGLKPQPPQRNSSSNLLRTPHVSHL